jgi:hypothetical protein
MAGVKVEGGLLVVEVGTFGTPRAPEAAVVPDLPGFVACA